ncbi:hypothetical protein HUJ05_001946 [Dendroctonus ponderosae]|nr:hypothetical protein HUJ05_001946 [Dendroctonus ponderosae]
MPGDAKTTSKWLMPWSRWALRTLVEVMAGHCGLNRHLHLLGIGDSPVCPQCGTAEKILFHLLGVCHHWSSLRRRVLGASTLSCTELETGRLGGEDEAGVNGGGMVKRAFKVYSPDPFGSPHSTTTTTSITVAAVEIKSNV